jgi:hypothetical protein
VDANTRMQMLQAQGAGAPPSEPPMAPPAEEGMEGEQGMPPPEVAIPQIAQMLMALAQGLPPEQASIVNECGARLQDAFAPKPPQGGEMSAPDAEAYGEPTAGM